MRLRSRGCDFDPHRPAKGRDDDSVDLATIGIPTLRVGGRAKMAALEIAKHGGLFRLVLMGALAFSLVVLVAFPFTVSLGETAQWLGSQRSL